MTACSWATAQRRNTLAGRQSDTFTAFQCFQLDPRWAELVAQPVTLRTLVPSHCHRCHGLVHLPPPAAASEAGVHLVECIPQRGFGLAELRFPHLGGPAASVIASKSASSSSSDTSRGIKERLAAFESQLEPPWRPDINELFIANIWHRPCR